MFEVTVANGSYKVEWKELDSSIFLGKAKTFEESEKICDKFWDEVVMPVRRLNLARNKG